jgi:transcriptional regulator with XRE-family HTH domain
LVSSSPQPPSHQTVERKWKETARQTLARAHARTPERQRAPKPESSVTGEGCDSPDPMTEGMDVGRRVRAARALAGLSRAELAERVAVSEAMVGRYETGHRHPVGERLERIAAACVVSVAFFHANLGALDRSVAELSAQMSSVEDRLARIEAELRIRL